MSNRYRRVPPFAAYFYKPHHNLLGNSHWQFRVDHWDLRSGRAVPCIWDASRAWLDGVLQKSTPSVQILKTQLSHARNRPFSHISALRAQGAEKGDPAAQSGQPLAQYGSLSSCSCSHIWSPRRCTVDRLRVCVWCAAGSIPRAGE